MGARLDFSGLQGVAQSVGNLGATFENIASQEKAKREQAAEYRFAAESQKRSVELQTFMQKQAVEFNKNWSSPDFDREGAAERMSSEIQEYYDINIKGIFDQNQAARFEANVLYPTLSYQQQNVNNTIAGFDIQAGKDANWYTVNNISSLISSGAKPKETLETGLDALDQLYQAGEFRSEAALRQQKDVLIKNANSSYLNIALDGLLDKGVEAKDVEGIINAIDQKNSNLAGEYSEEVADILSNLNTEGKNNLFEYSQAEEIKATMKSNILNEDINKDNTLKAEVSDINIELDTLQTNDKLTVASVSSAFEGRTDKFSLNSKATWMKSAKAEEDNKLIDQFSSMLLDVRAGAVTVAEVNNSPKWGLFHDQDMAKSLKEELVQQAKVTHDSGIAEQILTKYSNMNLPGPDVDQEYKRSERYKKGIYLDESDKELLGTMFDKDAAAEVETAISDGTTANLQAKQALELQSFQESTYLDLQKLIFNRGQSEEKEKREITNAYMRGEITEKMMGNLIKLVPIYGYTDQIKAAEDRIEQLAIMHAGGEENKEAVIHYKSLMWSGFTEYLDLNEDQDSPEFIQKALDAYLSNDPRVKEMMDYQYGKEDSRNWEPIIEGNGKKSDLNNLLWTLYDTKQVNSSSRFGIAYNYADKAIRGDIFEKFGDVPITYFEDDAGPLYTVEDATQVPGLVEMFSQQYPDADPSKTTIALQYGVVPGSKKNEIALYVGVVHEDNGVTWHNYSEELTKPTQFGATRDFEYEEPSGQELLFEETTPVPVRLDPAVAKTLYEKYGPEQIIALKDAIPNVVMREYSDNLLRLWLGDITKGVTYEDLKKLWDETRGDK